MSNRKGYPIIGGPLSGSFAKEADFRAPLVVQAYHMYHKSRYVEEGYNVGDTYPGGYYSAYTDDYVAVNRANGQADMPTRMWIHKDILRDAGVEIA